MCVWMWANAPSPDTCHNLLRLAECVCICVCAHVHVLTQCTRPSVDLKTHFVCMHTCVCVCVYARCGNDKGTQTQHMVATSADLHIYM